MDKGAKDKLAGSPGENGRGQDAQKGLHSRTGTDEMKRKTQERMERRSRKRSSSAGSDKMEGVGDRQGQMERYCSTGQSPQRAVAPREEGSPVAPRGRTDIHNGANSSFSQICERNGATRHGPDAVRTIRPHIRSCAERRPETNSYPKRQVVGTRGGAVG